MGWTGASGSNGFELSASLGQALSAKHIRLPLYVGGGCSPPRYTSKGPRGVGCSLWQLANGSQGAWLVAKLHRGAVDIELTGIGHASI